MLFKGTIYITYDINLCLANLNMCKTIIIADEPDSYRIPGSIGGSLLLPPYESLVSMIDGDDEKFRQEYISYLMNDTSVYKFLNIILQALMAGTNIIFLIDSNGPNFELVLKEFFRLAFGIIIGDSSNQFAFDITFVPMILNRLYADDDISKETYLTLYPQEILFEPFFINKLAYDYNLQLNINMHGYFKKKSLILKNGGIIRDVVKRPE